MRQPEREKQLAGQKSSERNSMKQIGYKNKMQEGELNEAA